MRTSANRYFRYSANSKRAVSRFDHQGSSFTFGEITGKEISVDVGKLMLKFGHRTRHVPVRGHHDQRIEIVLARPALGLERVAEGVERGAIEIDAAGEILGIKRRQPRDFARAGVAMHAGDQQPFAALGRQQFDRVGNARGRPGQHHDAVGLAVERHFLVRNAQDEPAESASPAARRPTAPAVMVKKPIHAAKTRCQACLSRSYRGSG